MTWFLELLGFRKYPSVIRIKGPPYFAGLTMPVDEYRIFIQGLHVLLDIEVVKTKWEWRP